MSYYKTFEDAFTAACEAQGMTDANGDLIKATGKPLNQQELIDHKTEVIKSKIDKLIVKKD